MEKTAHIRTARDTVVRPSGMEKIGFLRTASVFIKERLNADREEISSMKMELSLIEEGRLRIHAKPERNKVYFGLMSPWDAREVSITEDRSRIHLIARRKYLESRVKQAESNCYRLSRVLNNIDHICNENRIRNDLQRFSAVGLDLCKIIFSKEQNEWIDKPYSPNPFHKENLRYSTSGGIAVRSKSEAFIGNTLENLGIPYRYDDLVDIGKSTYGDKLFRDSYFADFKIPNLNGGITIHEHLGAFDIEKYPDNSLKRLNDYHNSELYELPGRRVRHNEITFSFESDLRDAALFRTMISKMLLPR
jgi:hypothetical protein